MSVAQYPTPYSAAHSSEPDGPGPGGTSPCGYILQRLPDEYGSVIVKEMTDKGATYGADTTNIVMRWQFTYTGLSAAQAAVLDGHRAAALDKLLGFNFRDPRTGTLYSNVHYDDYQYPAHVSYQSQSRIVTLIKRPA